MLKRIFPLSVMALLIMTACSRETQTSAETPLNASSVSGASAMALCENPAVSAKIRDDIQSIILQEAQTFAQQDTRQFIDVDKVIGANSQLTVQLNLENSADATTCSAQLVVEIPKNISKLTQENHALIYENWDKILKTRLQKSQATLKAGTFTVPLHFTAKLDKQNMALTYTDNQLSYNAQTLAIILIPYGVKDMVMVDGRAMSRQEALNLLKNPSLKQKASEPAESQTPKEVPTVTDTEILEKEQVEKTEKINPNDKVLSASQIIESSEKVTEPQPSVKPDVYQKAKQAHENADRDIKNSWRNIDPEIQRTLYEEQRQWESQKNQRCRQAAAKGTDDMHSAYLHLQCDIKQTRERIQYLNGYSIQE